MAASRLAAWARLAPQAGAAAAGLRPAQRAWRRTGPFAARLGLGALAGAGALAAAVTGSPAPAEAAPAQGRAPGGVRCLASDAGTKPIVARLLGKIRDKDSDQNAFVFYSDRLFSLLIEAALSDLDLVQREVQTPTGANIPRFDCAAPVAAVSVLRSGDALMNSFIQAAPGAPTGKLLLVKHEARGNPGQADYNVLYSRMPRNLDECQVLLMDPMMATGSTIVLALRVLTEEHGVRPERITVVSMISCPDAIKRVHKSFPNVRVVTAAIDPGLDRNHFVNPGLGSFGDRYFGTATSKLH